jgi:D-alanyl-D-alanine carboxypeptidase
MNSEAKNLNIFNKFFENPYGLLKIDNQSTVDRIGKLWWLIQRDTKLMG